MPKNKKKVVLRNAQDNPEPRRRVAIFDLDGTIFRSSLLIEILEGLIEEGVFPARARDIYGREFQNWLDRKGPYEDYIKKIIKAYSQFIKGVKSERVWQAARKVLAFQKNRTYRFTRYLVSKLKKNYYLLAISGSPREMVKQFGNEMGFNKTYSRIFETDEEGVFTGRILFEEVVSDKGKILRRVVKKENLTLEGSIGVGDTEIDTPFLKLVEYPIAFNPNLELYRYAKKRKWQIIVERKDVVYKLGRDRVPALVKAAFKKFIKI